MTRSLFLAVLLAPLLPAQDTPLDTVQKLFEAVLHKDAATATALFTPDAMLYSLRPDGTAAGMSAPKWIERMAASKDQWQERIYNPKQLEQGPIAQVWAEYDFHLAGKFSHCGIDSISLLKTATGWKIASISDTREKTNCPAR
jgi:hypothetical protein